MFDLCNFPNPSCSEVCIPGFEAILCLNNKLCISNTILTVFIKTFDVYM